MRVGCLTRRFSREGTGLSRWPSGAATPPRVSTKEETMRSTRATAAAAAALALALSACGSKSERSEESAQPTTTKQETTATTTAAAEPEPITAAEERWRKQIERYGQRLEDEMAVGGAITHSTMRRQARLYLECERVLSRAGDPGRFEPASRFAERACERLKKAAKFLDQAIASSERGGFVYAGSPEEEQFDHAFKGAVEAAGNGQYELQRALGRAEEIERSIGS
jgi:hypothetical protein